VGADEQRGLLTEKRSTKLATVPLALRPGAQRSDRVMGAPHADETRIWRTGALPGAVTEPLGVGPRIAPGSPLVSAYLPRCQICEMLTGAGRAASHHG
jgi:hypothetical protein